MKKIILSLLVLGAATFSSYAQTSDEGGKFSIGVDAGLPLGDSKDVSSFIIGGSLKYDHPIAENLFATLSAGYQKFLLKSDIKDAYKALGLEEPKLSAIPVKAGLKYFFDEGFFGEAQLGAAFLSDGGGTAFAYAPGVGYAFAGGFEAGVRYEAWSKNGTTSQVALRLAYKF